ncbi:hypothetical protein TNCV_2563291 [Trichonephila clavipes]|uniref:Uncharacterized protein n=1 Tax=Trichonephila clavipes TaxID=2585209 RepID=A0A8X6R2P6_TRICX|nr:hypothetical protein TNCV_2563291 [Trichonephila clavipes]
MPRIRRNGYHHISEFDSCRIKVYRESGLSFHDIVTRFGWNMVGCHVNMELLGSGDHDTSSSRHAHNASVLTTLHFLDLETSSCVPHLRDLGDIFRQDNDRHVPTYFDIEVVQLLPWSAYSPRFASLKGYGHRFLKN